MRSLTLLPPALLALLTTTVSAAIVPGRAFDRIINVFLSSQDFGPAAASPHIRALAEQGVLLSRYYAQTHPSQPNYLAAVAGDYFGLDHDGPVRVPINVSTVVDLLDAPGISWGAYMEAIPSPGFLADGSNGRHTKGDGEGEGGDWFYVRKHNPFVSFDSIVLNGSRLLNVLSMTDFEQALSDRSLPQYAFVTPDTMHDGTNTTLDSSALWVRSFLEPMLAPGAFLERTLILLTYNEAATPETPNRVVSLLLGNAIPEILRGTQDDTVYSHYSILSTLEYNWRLPHLGRFDVGANIFKAVLDLAGGGDVVNRTPLGAGMVNNSISYPGPLAARTRPSREGWWPVPNLSLAGPSGQGVAGRVKNSWKYQYQSGFPCPYDGSGEMYDGNHPPVNLIH